MTGYKSKRAAAQDKLVVTDIDGHVVRDARKPKKVALDRDAEIERLNEKIEFLARTNMLYSDWEHRDTQVTSDLIRKGIEEAKINTELRAEIAELKTQLAQTQTQKPVAWLEPEWGEKICPEVGYEVTMTDDHPRDLGWTPLYPHPPQEPWPEEPSGHMAGGVQPAQEPTLQEQLTEEQIWKCNRVLNENGEIVGVHICLDHQNVVDFARAIEREIGFSKAKLKEKNNG